MIYYYNIDSDFTNGINPSCLDRSIKELQFPNNLIGINVHYSDSTAEIVFEGVLSFEDEEDLNTLISNHNPSTTCEQEIASNTGSTKVDFSLNDQSRDYMSTKNDTWTVATTFIYEGSLNWIPQKFSIISSTEKIETTGYARLYDKTNNKELCSVTWTDIDKSITTTTEFYNLPNSAVITELQFKSSIRNNEIKIHYLALY